MNWGLLQIHFKKNTVWYLLEMLHSTWILRYATKRYFNFPIYLKHSRIILELYIPPKTNVNDLRNHFRNSSNHDTSFRSTELHFIYRNTLKGVTQRCSHPENILYFEWVILACYSILQHMHNLRSESFQKSLIVLGHFRTNCC